MVPEASRGGQMSPRNPRIEREASPPPSCSQPRTQMSPGGTVLAGFPGRLQGCVPGQRAVLCPSHPRPPRAAAVWKGAWARRQAAALAPEGAGCLPETHKALNPAMTEKNAPRNCLPG